MRLSRQLKPLGDLGRAWAVVEDKTALFVATGDEGKLFQVSPEERSRSLTKHRQSDLPLAITPEGTVFAGTDRRKDHSLGRGREAKVIADNLGSYVWSLVYDENERKFAGTGPKGRIYQVTPEGKSSLPHQAGAHLPLAARVDQAADGQGRLVYRLDGKDKAFVLHQAAQEKSAAGRARSVVFAGTSSPITKRTGPGRPAGHAGGLDRTRRPTSSS